MNKMITWLAAAFMLIAAQLTFAEDYQAGVHYKVLNQPVRTSDASKVEVVEMFGYWCKYCAAFESHVQPWKKTLADDVVFKPTPVVFRSNQEELAKAYYIAESLGVLDKTHGAMFNMVHKQGQAPGSREQLAKFFMNYGVSEKDFNKAYSSFTLNTALSTGRKKAMAYQLNGVPTLVVNGKYMITTSSAGGQAEMLKVADYLVAKEKQSQK